MGKHWIEKVNLEWASPQVLAALLAFTSVLFVGTGLLFLREQRRRALSRRLQGADFRYGPPAGPGRPGRFLKFLEEVGNVVSHGQASTSLWEQLIRAGYMSRTAPAIYTGIKILLFAAGLTITAALALPTNYTLVKKVSLISLGAVVPFFLPNLIVLYQVRQRRDEVRQYLPDVVDLLEICVTSGIGLDMAWNLVSQEIHHVSRVLGTAMDLSNFEMHLGASRTEAMRSMALRTGADQMSSLAAILVQSERFGTSVAVALKEFAASMREERRMTAEENAEKMAVKMIVPMVLCIFPAVVVVTIGPAAINIVRTLMPQ
jgi:tight adherence protein C